MHQYFLALDLKEDENLIAEYEKWHQDFWPEIRASIRESGILNMEIYRTANRLFMVMKTDDSFTFEHKKKLDDANFKVQEWEELMWQYQQPLPWAKDGEKWILLHKIFEL